MYIFHPKYLFVRVNNIKGNIAFYCAYNVYIVTTTYYTVLAWGEISEEKKGKKKQKSSVCDVFVP